MDVIKVKMTKVYRDNNLEGGLRTNEVVGICYELPTIGKSFLMHAESIEIKDGFRQVTTSRVKTVEQNGNVFNIETESNSKYTIEVLE